MYGGLPCEGGSSMTEACIDRICPGKQITHTAIPSKRYQIIKIKVIMEVERVHAYFQNHAALQMEFRMNVWDCA